MLACTENSEVLLLYLTERIPQEKYVFRVPLIGYNTCEEILHKEYDFTLNV